MLKLFDWNWFIFVFFLYLHHVFVGSIISPTSDMDTPLSTPILRPRSPSSNQRRRPPPSSLRFVFACLSHCLSPSKAPSSAQLLSLIHTCTNNIVLALLCCPPHIFHLHSIATHFDQSRHFPIFLVSCWIFLQWHGQKKWRLTCKIVKVVGGGEQGGKGRGEEGGGGGRGRGRLVRLCIDINTCVGTENILKNPVSVCRV